MSDDLVNIEIDGKPLKAAKGAMIIQAADAAGIQIPRFCYHKKLSVAVNCRMCLVEVTKIPKPVPACATPVAEGMQVFTHSEVARKAQKSVMEFLLINHPLDCPICDQGGECELQDVALGYGGDVSRFQERKRVVKDKNIGPLVATDMTRCIHCTRCVRFGEEIAGMRELGATGRGEDMEIGTYVARSVDSELSGNIIDLCPVGALTSKPFRFTARAWEMVQRDTIAPHDCVGSNLHVHIRGGRVMRVVPRENEAVNESWISDRDRFSYQGLNAEDRLTTPMIRRGEKWEATDWETALKFTADGLRKLIAGGGAGKLGALASPAATLEELFLLQKLVRGLGGANVDHRLRQADFSDQSEAPLFPWLGQSLAELENVDAALLVGSNLRKEQPLANHRLRKAALRGASVMLVNPLDYPFNYPIADKIIAAPAALVPALAGIAKALQGKSKQEGALAELLSGVRADKVQKAIAGHLKEAERATVLLGPTAMAHPRLSVLRALAGHIAEATGAALGYLPEGPNAAGAWLAGALPHRGPAGSATTAAGLDALAMLRQRLAGYVLLGVEPELDSWDAAAARAALAGSELNIVLSAYRSEEMQRYAHVLLPVAPFTETSGTFVNAEGRWQSFEGTVPPPGEARPAWKVLRVLGNQLDLAQFDYLASTDIRDEVRTLVGDARPDNAGAWKEPEALDGAAHEGLERIGETAVYGGDPVVRRAGALQRTAEAQRAGLRVNARLARKLKLADGGKAGVRQGEAEVVLPVAVDEGVPDGCVLLPGGIPESAGLGPLFGEIELTKA